MANSKKDKITEVFADVDAKATRLRRNKALSDLALIVENLYGYRCSMNEAGCVCCVAWAAFDMVSTITDMD